MSDATIGQLPVATAEEATAATKIPVWVPSAAPRATKAMTIAELGTAVASSGGLATQAELATTQGQVAGLLTGSGYASDASDFSGFVKPDLMAGAIASSEMRRALAVRDPGGVILLDYVDGNTRYIYTPLDGTYSRRWRMEQVASTGAWQMAGLASVRMFAAWDDTEPGITYGGGSWGAASGTGTALGGGYRSNSTSGRYVEFQVTGFTELWIAHAKRTNGGITYVTIDGGTTLVNELPLNGANRELSMYAAVDDHNAYTKIASGLTPASTYTVRLTNNGAVGAGGGTFLHFSGYGYPSSDLTNPRVTTLVNNALVDRLFSDLAYIWEYAYEVAPVGSSNFHFSGMGHENEILLSSVFQDGSGVPVTVSLANKRAVVDTLTVVQSLNTTHPDTGTTSYADVAVEHRFTSRGLSVWHSHDWKRPCMVRNAYAHMYAFDDSTTRGQVAGDFGRAYDLTADDGSLHGKLPALSAALWHPDHPWVGWLYVTDFRAVNGFRDTELKMWIQDRALSDGKLRNKIYYTWVSTTPVLIAAGDVVESTALYGLTRVASVADLMPLA